MRALPTYASLSIIALVGCTTPTSEPHPSEVRPPEKAAGSTEGEAAMQEVIPARYQHVWQLPELDRWDAYWIQQYPADSTGDLRQRTADLDGDGGLDQALFLCRVDTAQRDSSYALVVAFSNGRDTLLVSYPWAESQGGIGMGLALEAPGALGHLGGEEGEAEIPSPVNLTQPAVTVIFFEKASITWFWSKGSFHQVWTGD